MFHKISRNISKNKISQMCKDFIQYICKEKSKQTRIYYVQFDISPGYILYCILHITTFGILHCRILTNKKALVSDVIKSTSHYLTHVIVESDVKAN